MVASPFIGYWIVQEEYFLAMSWQVHLSMTRALNRLAMLMMIILLLRFFLASATDSVDGFIAKRFNLKSVIGSFLGARSVGAGDGCGRSLTNAPSDPVADKLLVTIMVTTMAYKSLLPRKA